MSEALTPQPRLLPSIAHVTVADALEIHKDTLAQLFTVDVEKGLPLTIAENVRPRVDLPLRFSEIIREVELRRISVVSAVLAIMDLHLRAPLSRAGISHNLILQSNIRLEADRLAEQIVTAACELDGPAHPFADDTISITIKDLEAVVHRHVTAAWEAQC